MQVKDLMTSPVITVGPEMDFLKAVTLMNLHRVGGLVVVRGKKPIGIMTERDIMIKVVGRSASTTHLKVSDVMSTPILTIMGNDSLETATKVMVKRRVRRLPVVSKSGDLIGIITSTDIIRGMPHAAGLLTKRAKLD